MFLYGTLQVDKKEKKKKKKKHLSSLQNPAPYNLEWRPVNNASI